MSTVGTLLSAFVLSVGALRVLIWTQRSQIRADSVARSHQLFGNRVIALVQRYGGELESPHASAQEET